MPKLIIKDIDPELNGSYEFKIERFKNSELRLIKQQAGVRAGELSAAFKAGDNDLIVCIALIVLVRSGKGDAEDLAEVLWNAESGQIDLDFSEEAKAEQAELDAVPPPNEPATGGGSDSTTSGSTIVSGAGSR